jgi:hypothetical protein
VALCSSVITQAPAATITSDASGRWGCGAFTDGGEWFQVRWLEEWEVVHITTKELIPIMVACAVWGGQWPGSTIQCSGDNVAVVAIIKSGSFKDPCAMHLIRSLVFHCILLYSVASHAHSGKPG